MKFLDWLPNDIPFLPKKNQIEEFYFALNIDKNSVEAAVWGIIGKRLEIFSISSVAYDTEDKLIEAANHALDEALGTFHPEPEKILFGVPDSWLQDEELKEDKLKLLKHMVKELGVSPLAYVSTSQAISHFLKQLSGVPLTAILVKIDDPLVVTVFKAGKNVGSIEVKRTGNLPEDIEKALLTFTDIEVLPSKIIIYDSNKSEKLKDELHSYSWMSQLPFLHLPKIEQLPLNDTIEAICLAGGSELHPDVNYHPKVMPGVTTHPESYPIKHLEPYQAEKIGFRRENLEHRRLSHEEEMTSHTDEERHTHGGDSQLVLTPVDKVKALVTSSLSLIKRPVSSLGMSSAPSGNFAKNFLRSRRILIGGLVLILLIGGMIFLPKAKVTVFIDLKVLERESQITADPKVSVVDEAAKTIPGKLVEEVVTGTNKEKATGKKKIGDPAKGKVVLYNKTNSQKNLSVGTVLSGPNNLKFALDTSVEIASQSSSTGADFATIIKPGRSDTVSSTAQSIGPDGNIAAGTELSVAGFSEGQMVARVDSAFSGGVSKEVTVVTADDQKKLLASLASELRKKAKEEIQGKLTGDQKVLEEGLAEEITKKSYSKNVGDQAQEFSLNLTINYKGVSYSDSDLKTIVSKLVETNIPQGFQLDLSQTETQADVSKLDKDNKLIFIAKFKAKLQPKIDSDQIRKELVFKTPQQAAERLKRIENVIGFDIVITPSIPIGPLQRLPLIDKNISIEVTAK